MDMTEKDLLSSTAFPAVFDDYLDFKKKHGDLSVVPTPIFLHGLPLNRECAVELEKGKELIVTLEGMSPEADKSGMRSVSFNFNGEARKISVLDRSAAVNLKKREQVQKGLRGSVGAPLQGLVVSITVKVGDRVKPGDSMATLSAMKMETSITATVTGTISRIVVTPGETLAAGDLILEITPDA